MGKKTMKNSEEKLSHKIPVASSSGHQKQQKSSSLKRQQKLEGLFQLIGFDKKDESVRRLLNKVHDFSRQRSLARKLVKNPINLSRIPNLSSEETKHLCSKMTSVSAGENVPETVLVLLKGKLMDKFGSSYSKFVDHLLGNIWLKVHLRCLQEDAGVSDEAMLAEMRPLHQLKLLVGSGNNTAVASVERIMKVLVTEFGLDTPCSYPVQDIITELVEKMVNAFAKVAPDDAMAIAVQGISLAK